MSLFDYKKEINSLLSRQDQNGGFSEITDGDYRPDTTAWVILCLDAYKTHSNIAIEARARLRSSQKTNGSIPLSTDHPEAFWPTFPGALALFGDQEHKDAYTKAINFLISTTGKRYPNGENDSVGHDKMLKGWPWIDQTHSWVEPTAIAVRALTQAGLTKHERTVEGVKLLVNRQLNNGGWNCGVTSVYGQQLNPMPASTGMALWALANQVDQQQVSKSLEYLQEQIHRIKTPLSLGWAFIGLSSWGVEIEGGNEIAVDGLIPQRKYGTYNTSHIAILLLAIHMMDSQGAKNG